MTQKIEQSELNFILLGEERFKICTISKKTKRIENEKPKKLFHLVLSLLCYFESQLLDVLYYG